MKQECKNASDEANEYVKYHTSHITYKLEEVAKRYEFSNYIIDPNKYSFEKVIRVLAMVYKFLDNCKNKCVNHHHHHCSTAVETMDSTIPRQTSRSIIAVRRSSCFSPVSLDMTSGNVSFRPPLFWVRGFHRSKSDTISCSSALQQ